MHDREFINNFLKVNGISADSTDAEVRRVLDDARWTEEEITVALFILRGINSRNLSRLLGGDVVVDPSLISSRAHSHNRSQRYAYEDLAVWSIIALLSVILALVVAWLLLFTMKIGPYQSSSPW
jgi:hypothetical protein